MPIWSKAAECPGRSQFGCLCTKAGRFQLVQRQQNVLEGANLVAFALRPEEANLVKGSRMSRKEPIWLPLVWGRKKPTWSKAAECPGRSQFGCLCTKAGRSQLVQRQQNVPEGANLVAFGLEPEEANLVKGSRMPRIEPNWLPLLLSCHINKI